MSSSAQAHRAWAGISPPTDTYMDENDKEKEVTPGGSTT